MPEQESIAQKIETTLREARLPLTVDEICNKVYGRVGSRERGTVHQNLHRLFEKDLIEKLPMRYAWKEEEIPFG